MNSSNFVTIRQGSLKGLSPFGPHMSIPSYIMMSAFTHQIHDEITVPSCSANLPLSIVAKMIKDVSINPVRRRLDNYELL